MTREVSCVVVEQAMTQEGSRLLQIRIARERQHAAPMIFHAVIDSITSLMMNQHGRYVVTKILPYLEEGQLLMILCQLTEDNGSPILKLSLNENGCYCLQRLVRPFVHFSLEAAVVAALARGFWLMKNGIAQHVIIKCVELVPLDRAMPLYQAYLQNWLHLATNIVSRRALDQFIDRMKGPLKVDLVGQVADQSLLLADHPSGSFIESPKPELSNLLRAKCLIHLKDMNRISSWLDASGYVGLAAILTITIPMIFPPLKWNQVLCSYIIALPLHSAILMAHDSLIGVGLLLMGR